MKWHQHKVSAWRLLTEPQGGRENLRGMEQWECAETGSSQGTPRLPALVTQRKVAAGHGGDRGRSRPGGQGESWDDAEEPGFASRAQGSSERRCSVGN